MPAKYRRDDRNTQPPRTRYTIPAPSHMGEIRPSLRDCRLVCDADPGADAPGLLSRVSPGRVDESW
jgi:hypothetical protein